MPFTQGQILEDNEKSRRKVLAVCGELYALSLDYDHEIFRDWLTEKQILDEGYKPVAEEWKPKIGEEHWFVDSVGQLLPTSFTEEGVADYRLSTGNYFKTREEAEKYRQWLLDNPYPQGK